LVKSMLDAIPIYWHSLAFIPKGVLEKISFRFLWYQKKESEGIPLVKWKAIENPKDMGGWELTNYINLGRHWLPRAFGDS